MCERLFATETTSSVQYFGATMDHISELVQQLLSTRTGVVVVLGLSFSFGFALLLIRDAVFGVSIEEAHGHVDMNRKIIEEEESNLQMLRNKSKDQ